MVEMRRMIVSSIMFPRHRLVIPPNSSTLSMYSTVSWIMSNAALLFHRFRRWLNKMESEREILLNRFESQSECWPPCAKDSKSIVNVIKGYFCILVEFRASIHWRTNSFSGKMYSTKKMPSCTFAAVSNIDNVIVARLVVLSAHHVQQFKIAQQSA